MTMVRLRRLARDRRGNTVIEFAIVAPVMIALIMGLLDLGFQVYAQSVLDGAVQKAARDSALQGGAQSTSTIDARVLALLNPLIGSPQPSCATTLPSTRVPATWCVTRKNYDNFAAIKPEPFSDTNGNGLRDPGECFQDINGNFAWDADPGSTGQGGANDVTLYTFAVTYPRLFPIAAMIGWPAMLRMSSTTILKNQPYASQATTEPKTICT